MDLAYLRTIIHFSQYYDWACKGIPISAPYVTLYIFKSAK
jgi:hypothetical protein